MLASFCNQEGICKEILGNMRSPNSSTPWPRLFLSLVEVLSAVHRSAKAPACLVKLFQIQVCCLGEGHGLIGSSASYRTIREECTKTDR